MGGLSKVLILVAAVGEDAQTSGACAKLHDEKKVRRSIHITQLA